MRWPVCAVLLVGACFNDRGGFHASTSAGSTSSSTGTTDAPATTTDGVPTSGPTSGATDSATAGQGTTGTQDTGTTASSGCNPPCTACQTCVDGLCVNNPPESLCIPAADACDGVVWGLQGGSCYSAEPGPGACDDAGQCVAKCSEKGNAIALCQDSECVRADHPCVAGMPIAGVTFDTLCVSDDTTTPACSVNCNLVIDQVEFRQCSAGGACQIVASEGCGAYSCDPQATQCNTTCVDDLGCADAHVCMQQMCVPM